jgi:soluble lytic murein transglycosylase
VTKGPTESINGRDKLVVMKIQTSLLLVALLVVSLIVRTDDAFAQASRNTKLQGKSNINGNAAALESSPAEAFKQARAAVARQDITKFNQVASAAAQHPLGMYVEYWGLRLRFNQAARLDTSETVDAALVQQASAFIAKQPNSMAADLLRRDWMLAAGKQGDWARVESLNKDWVLQDDKNALCYAAWLQVKKMSSVEPSVKDALAYGGAFNDGCDGFAVDAARLGKVTPEQLQSRIASAAFANASGSLRRLLEGSAAWAAVSLDAVWSKPTAFVNQPSGRVSRETQLLAYWRLALQDPDAAAAQLQTDRALSDADKAAIWSFIAASAARKTQPEAASYVATAARLKVQSKTQFNLPDEVAVWAVRGALRGQDWKSIAAMIDTMGAELRRDPAWVYWKARADRGLGAAKAVYEKDLASIAGQAHFYGQLAAEELGQLVTFPSTANETPEDPAATAANSAAVNAVIKSTAVARALQFYELNMRFEGNREWNWAIRGLTDKQLLAVSRWAYQQQLFDRAVSTAERTQTQHDYSARMITPFKEPLLAAAKRYDLDPAYVYGLVKQESRFLPDVKSSVGASGLMQLMPATARWVAKRINLDDFDLAQLGQPETNLNMGSFYLRTVMDGLDGNPGLAAAAYNAGPNRPRSWRSNLTTKIDGAAFAECIPFSETRDYVKKVLSNTVLYAAYFTGQAQSLKARLGEIAPKVAVPADTP